MVTQARAVDAHASCAYDKHVMDAIGKEFERNPLDTFVVFLAADATRETLTLLIQFIDSKKCTIDMESMGVITVVLLVWDVDSATQLPVVIPRSSALGRLRYEPPERANVGGRRCCIAGHPLGGGPSEVVHHLRSCWG